MGVIVTFKQRIDSISACGIITKVISVPGSGLMSQFSLYHLLLTSVYEIVVIFILPISHSGQRRLGELKQLIQVPQLKGQSWDSDEDVAYSRAHCLNCYMALLLLDMFHQTLLEGQRQVP